MKVALVAESFLPRINGVTNSVLRSAEYLERQGHKAVVIAPGLAGPSQIGNVPIVRVPSVAVPGIPDVDVARVSVRKLVKCFLELKPDVIHLASPFVLGDRAGKAAQLLGIPVVAIYQTDVIGFANHYGFGSMEALVQKWTARVHQRADLNLAPSSAASKQLQDLGVLNVQHWGRGVDLEQFNPKRRSEKLHNFWSEKNKVVVGYVGRLAPEKQILDLKQVISDQIQLVVIGDGPQRSELKQELTGAIFTGSLSGADLGEAIASLDLLVAPGELETFCQVIQEAMASGVPVVAPNIGGPIDLIKHGQTGFLYQAKNLSEMQKYVNNLSGNQETRNMLGQNARNDVANRSWDNICAQLVNHYRSVLRTTEIKAA
ncbi:MAG: hypothetical protein RL587_863 [Actinomycetota bacterium]|jgi:phosphatidylinositol alpha 1,6-mannosyltransferase